jgi:hypothetical protein
MSNPIDAASIPRRNPLIQSAIEALQNADDEMRHGKDATIPLIVAQAAIETLMDKEIGKGEK